MPHAPRNAAEKTVRDPEAAALLVDGRRNRFLHPFLGRACGVTEAARGLGVTPSLVSYWVGRFRRAGLLQAVGPTTARARAYRTVADAFVVALHDMPQVNEDEILDAQMDVWVQQVKESLLRVGKRHATQWQFRMARGPEGVRQILEPVGGSLADVPLVNERGALYLTPDDAAALRSEMRTLLGRYAQRSAPEHAPGHLRTLVWAVAVDAPKNR